MNRSEFIKGITSLFGILPFSNIPMSLKELNRLISFGEPTFPMPVLFLGHGSPMNAIEDNEFVRTFKRIGEELPRPKAILCISAHWETKGTYVTAMEKPRTIYDFGGFPRALFEVQYPAPGSPQLADEMQGIISKPKIGLDFDWGLDHGAWSVVIHLFPKAEIPVVQMSLDYSMDTASHFELAKKISLLRERGVLIIGSGNMVHNLGMMDWHNISRDFAFDWASLAAEKMRKYILNNQFDLLLNYKNQGQEFGLAIPTPEHFLPLLYVLGLKRETDQISLFNDKTVAGSIAMTSVKIEQA